MSPARLRRSTSFAESISSIETEVQRVARRKARDGTSLARLEGVLAGFERLRVVVIGDVILDEYLWGNAERVSPEAPVPVVHVQRESFALGGAANVARNVVALGAECALCGVTGSDPAGQRLRELVAELGVDPSGLVDDAARPTTRKTRIVARSQQILRYDRETSEPLSRAGQRALAAAATAALPRASGLILEDYGKGTLTSRLVRRLIAQCRDAGLPVAVDPKSEIAAYRGAALLKPNLSEAHRLVGVDSGRGDELARLLPRLQRKLPGTDLAITRGGAGISVCEAGGEPQDVATVQCDVFDVQGAGDTTIAALFMARLAGASLVEAAVIANAAAGVVIGKIGTAAASRDEIRSRLEPALEACRSGLSGRMTGENA